MSLVVEDCRILYDTSNLIRNSHSIRRHSKDLKRRMIDVIATFLTQLSRWCVKFDGKSDKLKAK